MKAAIPIAVAASVIAGTNALKVPRADATTEAFVTTTVEDVIYTGYAVATDADGSVVTVPMGTGYVTASYDGDPITETIGTGYATATYDGEPITETIGTGYVSASYGGNGTEGGYTTFVVGPGTTYVLSATATANATTLPAAATANATTIAISDAVATTVPACPVNATEASASATVWTSVLGSGNGTVTVVTSKKGGHPVTTTVHAVEAYTSAVDEPVTTAVGVPLC